MGYSENPITVENRKAWLGPLMDGKPARWTCQPGAEKKLAYDIRECFNVARLFPQTFPGLYQAAQTMEISIPARGVVQAQPKIMPGVENIHVELYDPSKAGPSAEPVGLTQIVDAWIKRTGQDIMRFGQTSLDKEDLFSLYKWTQERGILMFWSAPSVTLREYDAELAAFSFDPEEDM